MKVGEGVYGDKGTIAFRETNGCKENYKIGEPWIFKRTGTKEGGNSLIELQMISPKWEGD